MEIAPTNVGSRQLAQIVFDKPTMTNPEQRAQLDNLHQQGILDDDAYNAAIARLEGAGAIAQGDGAVAAGEQGIAIGGNITNSLIRIYVNGEEPQVSQEAYQSALERYVNHLLTTHQVLNLRGIRSFQPISIELENAYVTLRALDPTRTERILGEHKGRRRTEALEKLDAADARPQALQSLLAQHPRLVVLGDPGSGKSTFVAYLALSAARAIAADDPELARERLSLQVEAEQNGVDAVPLPLLLPLREFGRYLRTLDQTERLGPQPHHLLNYLRSYYDGWNLDLPDDFFDHHLDAGRCLILLDGLDEVADYTDRVLVREQVEAFVQRYGVSSTPQSQTPSPQSPIPNLSNRFVVTCRVRGYEDQAKLGQNFETTTVLPFDNNDIQRFTQAWSLAVESAQARSAAESVRSVARRSAEELYGTITTNPKVRELAGNPLLVTVIALVHRYRAKLPERRSELYNECTEVLLGYWELGKTGEESKRLATYTGTDLLMDASEKRSFLEPVALTMHQAEVREWEREQLIDAFAAQFSERGHAEQKAKQMAADFLLALTVRSGLLQEVEQNMFGFLHLTFQEYLAARALADQTDYIETTLTHLDNSWWRETIRLEAGHLSESGRSRVSRLVDAIFDAPDESGANQILAANCLTDVGQNKMEAAVWQRVSQTLRTRAFSDAPAAERAKAAAAFGHLGDDRRGVGVDPETGLPDIAWCKVEPAPFIMGMKEDETTYDEDKPQFTCHLVKDPYRISRYPVTVAQFGAFTKAGGYHEERFWTADGWSWRQAEDVNAPRTSDAIFQTPNHAQVGVSWYEAVAFCHWLSEASVQTIRLPNEAEWELAARHTDGRAYPWGDEFDAQRCNMAQTDIDSTCAVGLFEEFNAHCGAADMSGNVWEWTSSKWLDTLTDYEQKVDNGLDGTAQRALRGGSWSFYEYVVRCAVRNHGSPSNVDNEFGFRVVSLGC